MFPKAAVTREQQIPVRGGFQRHITIAYADDTITYADDVKVTAVHFGPNTDEEGRTYINYFDYRGLLASTNIASDRLWAAVKAAADARRAAEDAETRLAGELWAHQRGITWREY